MTPIYCVSCQKDVEVQPITGREAYPHRPDLATIPLWQCPHCNAFVGSHRTGKPLGVIPTPELKRARQLIHARLDPLWTQNWRADKWTRSNLYKAISKHLGYKFHTAELRSMEEARKVYDLLNRFYTTTKRCPF